jgi:tRNA pseudouridine55 synthase
MSRRPHPGIPDPDGILLIDKPTGMTSHDMVDGVRRMFRFGKVGHGGTLDPMATGLLILLIGKATRLFDTVMGGDKTYEGVFRLGVETDTEDRDGQILSRKDASGVTAEQLAVSLAARKGDLMQTPPMVSAIKRDGVPLYKLARSGKTVEREPRLIHVYDFQLLGFTPPDARFRLICTKGTYVRTLGADIGRELGCGACLVELRRTASGPYRVENAIPLETLRTLSRPELESRIIPARTVTESR